MCVCVCGGGGGCEGVARTGEVRRLRAGGGGGGRDMLVKWLQRRFVTLLSLLLLKQS